MYEAVLAKQLQLAGLTVHRQVPIPIIYEGISFDEGFRADLIVNQSVIIELKSVEAVHPVHKKQLLALFTYPVKWVLISCSTSSLLQLEVMICAGRLFLNVKCFSS